MRHGPRMPARMLWGKWQFTMPLQCWLLFGWIRWPNVSRWVGAIFINWIIFFKFLWKKKYKISRRMPLNRIMTECYFFVVEHENGRKFGESDEKTNINKYQSLHFFFVFVRERVYVRWRRRRRQMSLGRRNEFVFGRQNDWFITF